jgi:ABC-type polysaccharide/polyol phosphate export permease
MWLKEAKKRFPITFGGLKKVAFTILILLLAALLFETIGYFLTVFLLIVFLMMVGTELKSWKKIIITALLTAIGVYIVFVLLLEQPFPRGLLRI